MFSKLKQSKEFHCLKKHPAWNLVDARPLKGDRTHYIIFEQGYNSLTTGIPKSRRLSICIVIFGVEEMFYYKTVQRKKMVMYGVCCRMVSDLI